MHVPPTAESSGTRKLDCVDVAEYSRLSARKKWNGIINSVTYNRALEELVLRIVIRCVDYYVGQSLRAGAPRVYCESSLPQTVLDLSFTPVQRYTPDCTARHSTDLSLYR